MDYWEDTSLSLIITYIGEMIGYILVALPLYVLIRLIIIKKRKKTTSLGREAVLGLFALYMVGLLSQTVLPIWNAGIMNGKPYFNNYIYKPAPINIIPFHTIYQYLYSNNSAVDGWEVVSTLHLWANLLLFVPLGIFLPLLSKKYRSLLRILLSGFISSLCIEFIQFFIGRRADIDDVILNVIGVLFGFIIYRGCRSIIRSIKKIGTTK